MGWPSDLGGWPDKTGGWPTGAPIGESGSMVYVTELTGLVV